MNKKVMYILLSVIGILVISLSLFQIQAIRDTFPTLSPFFPDYAPQVEVSVTLLTANSPPIILGLNSSIFVCEDEILDYWFNISDPDGDAMDVSLFPTNPFYISPSSGVGDQSINLWSVPLSKAHANGSQGGWRVFENRRIEVTDNYNTTCCSDTKYTNITVIEINHAPIIQQINNTAIYTTGPNTLFYLQVLVTDEEDTDPLNLGYNFTLFNPAGDVSDLFNMSSNLIINFTADTSTPLGNYNVSICFTDRGLLNPHQNLTLECNVTESSLTSCLSFILVVADVSVPPVIPPSGGGGGGGGTRSCVEDWFCTDWGICKNATEKLEEGILSGDEYREILEGCNAILLFDQSCGMQSQQCFDLNNCNTTFNKPNIIQSCYYTEDPRCDDGIKNCHSGGCELLIDCGGPCAPCPTCSDNLQNQGEEGVDCGGPCPVQCKIAKPMPRWMKYILLIIGIILVILAIIIGWRIYISKKMVENPVGNIN